jgi:hypothetical protein
MFELTYRTITQNPSQVDDWGRVLEKLVKYPYINVEKCEDYVNGSFSMNSPPERRRAAFCMIRHLMEVTHIVIKLVFKRNQENCGEQGAVLQQRSKLQNQNRDLLCNGPYPFAER